MSVVLEKKQRTDSVVTVITKRKERTNWNAAPVAHIDKNGFGRKILEKFGWSPGEGLGAEKQGIKEHLKAKMKTDNAGIGFKNSGEEWLKQQNDFSELLANLSGSNTEVEEEEVSISTGRNSLELKSKQSRARVHYHKFTRGKDLSRYSSKDLAQILGPETLKSHASKVSGNNINHINRGSMVNYFQKKAVLWDAHNEADCEMIQSAESKNNNELLTHSPYDNDDDSDSQHSAKKNKNKECLTSWMQTSNILESSIKPVCNKQEYRRKKKKKEKHSLNTYENNIDNSTITSKLEGNFTVENISNSMENKPESSEFDKQKKKRKRHNQCDIDRNENENSAGINNDNYPEEFVENDLYISSPKKKKKKEKQLYK